MADKARGNNDPDPNIGRVIERPGPDRQSPVPDDPDKQGMGQGGQPPHQYPGQRPTEPHVERRTATPSAKEPLKIAHGDKLEQTLQRIVGRRDTGKR